MEHSVDFRQPPPDLPPQNATPKRRSPRLDARSEPSHPARGAPPAEESAQSVSETYFGVLLFKFQGCPSWAQSWMQRF